MNACDLRAIINECERRQSLTIELERTHVVALGEGHLRQEARRHAALLVTVLATVHETRLLDERHAGIDVAGCKQQHALDCQRDRQIELMGLTDAAPYPLVERGS